MAYPPPSANLEPGAIPVPADVETLRLLCREFRKDLLDLTIHSGTGSSHIGGELSLVEILSVLFFHTLRLNPRDPEWPARDRFILSKGHASAAMYVAMAWRGFFPRERLFDSVQPAARHLARARQHGYPWGGDSHRLAGDGTVGGSRDGVGRPLPHEA